MAVLAELTTYINAQIPTWVGGTNMFYNLMPPDPDVALVLYEYGGSPNEPNMGKGTTNLVFPRIQARTRGVRDDQITPRANLQAIVTLFTAVVNVSIGGIPYLAIEPLSDPQFLARDENWRYEFIVNFKVTKGYSAT